MAEQTYGLEHLEFSGFGKVYRNLTIQELVEHEYQNNEAKFGPAGAVVVNIEKYPERRPEIKYFVDEASTTEDMWWGSGNKKITAEVFDRMQARVLTHLSNDKLYINDVFCGQESNRISIRMVSKKAWHAHFFHNLYFAPTDEELEKFQPEYTILNACGYEENEFEKMGLSDKSFVLVNLETKMILIGGTENSDEMKKVILSIMNFLLPLQGILTLSSAANIGKENDVALFIGCEGSGKTTLSNDPNKRSWHRRLIGDAAHAWTDDGVFNLENGCYAKCLNLDRELEPDIYRAVRFGAVMENVIMNDKREAEYQDSSRTENTRVAYQQNYIHNPVIPGKGGHPDTIIILANDLYGVLPPVARLTPDQAVYYFLSGYSSQQVNAGGEMKLRADFSFCFGGSFMTLRPNIYAELLAQKIERHGTTSFLVSTGWTGGSIGTGQRIPLTETRRIVDAILDGSVNNSVFVKDPVFGIDVPKQLTGVDSRILIPQNTWEDQDAFEAARKELAGQFIENFEKYAKDGPETGDIIATKYLYNEYNKLSSAGPHV
ncbi:MAG: phosphoenolpyruvate carboxykinase (ATP) [Proteobacteria bacterium]|nr:phosphoenolpyruvate carboxykinase (ATP) [Pseudomonadota bacterium]